MPESRKPGKKTCHEENDAAESPAINAGFDDPDTETFQFLTPREAKKAKEEGWSRFVSCNPKG